MLTLSRTGRYPAECRRGRVVEAVSTVVPIPEEVNLMRHRRFLAATALAALVPVTLGVPVLGATSATDPASDALFSAPGFMDIVRAELTRENETYSLHMSLAVPVPSQPTLPPPASATVSWGFPIDSDPTTFPAGTPFAPGNGQSGAAEFNIVVFWDGAFSASLLDRRPLLHGAEAIYTPLPFAVSDGDIRIAVDAALLDDPSSFRWGAVTVYSSASPGSNSGRHFVDVLEPFYNVWP